MTGSSAVGAQGMAYVGQNHFVTVSCFDETDRELSELFQFLQLYVAKYLITPSGVLFILNTLASKPICGLGFYLSLEDTSGCRSKMLIVNYVDQPISIRGFGTRFAGGELLL